jgi:tRNA(Ile)-lysidine synthase
MQFVPTKLRELEFRVFQDLSKRRSEWEGKRVLIACSGGLDSIALARVLVRVLPRLKASAGLAYIHHGSASSIAVSRFRKKALTRVAREARDLGIPFHAAQPADPSLVLESEATLRRFRMKALARLRRGHGYDVVAFAHHADDLLETRLIRLVRGTGSAGLRAMSAQRGVFLRPFLDIPKARLLAYAAEKKLDWVEDPSNLDPGPLRNWIREEWLPALEAKRAGSRAALARSLETIVADMGEGKSPCLDLERGEIDRKLYLRLDITKRRSVLAAYLRGIGARDFGTTHVEELRKRIETSRKEVRFQLLKFEWTVNTGLIRAERFSAPAHDGVE